MNPVRALLGVAVCAGGIAACGSRSGFDDGTTDASIADGGSSGAAPGPVGVTDAATGSADADAALPERPCHLIRTGDPFRTLWFPEPTYSFRQDGLLLRSEGTRVVQYGNVTGIRTGVWDDPAIWAAEYDVATWPPTPLHEQTQLFHSMHDPADLLELPGGKLGLAWFFDNDGQGPYGVKYRTIDATSWALDTDAFLAENARTWSRPVLGTGRDLLVSTYERVTYGDGGASIASFLGHFDLDGKPHGEPLPLWSEPHYAYGIAPTEAVARTGTSTLAALAFDACGDASTSPFCEARSVVVLRAVAPAGGGAARLEKVSAVPVRDPGKVPSTARILSDGAARVLLTWWEVDAPKDGGSSTVRYLYAAPISPEGVLSGPIERWYVDDALESYDYFPIRDAAIGRLGAIYPVTRTIPVDAGKSLREVHLVHRQLDPSAPVEEIVFTTSYTSFPVAVAQIAATRTLIVAYSTYPADSTRGYGELVRYGCSEDAK